MNFETVKELSTKRPVWLGLFVLTCGALRFVAGCSSLSSTTPIPTLDASDLDGGFVGERPPDAAVDEEEEEPPPPDVQPARARLANLVRGSGNLDLCMKVDTAAGAWEGGKITQNPLGARPAGLAYGEVSAHVLVPITARTGTRYTFRAVAVGSSCEEGTPVASFTLPGTTTVPSGGGVTLVAVGIAGAGGQYAPRGTVTTDVITVAEGIAQLRLFHGVPDLPAVDFYAGGLGEARGIRYGTAIPFPYTSTSGFAGVDGGVGDGMPIRITTGAFTREFRLGRVRTRNAATVFLAGLSGLSDAGDDPPISALLCQDDPLEGANLGDCTPLSPL